MNEMSAPLPVREQMSPSEGVFTKVQRFLKERYTPTGRAEKALREIESVNGPLTPEQKSQVAEQIMPQVKGEVTKAIVGDALAATAVAGTAVGTGLFLKYRNNEAFHVATNVRFAKGAERFAQRFDKSSLRRLKALEDREGKFVKVIKRWTERSNKKVQHEVVRFGKWAAKDTSKVLKGALQEKGLAAKAVEAARKAIPKAEDPKAAREALKAAQTVYKASGKELDTLTRTAKKIDVEAPVVSKALRSAFKAAERK